MHVNVFVHVVGAGKGRKKKKRKKEKKREERGKRVGEKKTTDKFKPKKSKLHKYILAHLSLMPQTHHSLSGAAAVGWRCWR